MDSSNDQPSMNNRGDSNVGTDNSTASSSKLAQGTNYIVGSETAVSEDASVAPISFVTPPPSTSSAGGSKSVSSSGTSGLSSPSSSVGPVNGLDRASSSSLDSPPVLEDYSVKCDNCGRFGVKRTYQLKSLNFCSQKCSRAKRKLANSQAKVRTHRAMESDAEDVDGSSSRCSTPVDEQDAIRSSSSASNSVDFDGEGAPDKKKKKVEVDPTFDWKTLISDSEFKAASVGLMKHAPLSRMWDNVTIGMKLEVENKDIDPRNHQIAFWVASVVKIQGYLVLLRFEGFGNDPTGDFWINLCSHDIHHVGWCANKGKPLIPPRSISRKFTDWRNFLVNRLTGARTLPQNFQAKVQNSLKSKYEVGDHLEVVDKNRICRLRLATVRKIVGRRLHVEYFDSEEDGGFWCHEESRLIHPKGWAKTIGHEILAPRTYNPGTLLPTPYDAEFEEMGLQVGMKLEAIDPLNLSAICAATIKKVLRRGYVMVRVDCYEEDSNSNGYDWFCYHISSPYVFPCGFCEMNDIVLTPPYGYDKATFNWSDYMETTRETPAPVKQKKTINHKFKVGMKVEAADLMDPRLICVATISHIVGRLLKIHFNGWEEEYDQWLDARSPDIYPVGWCELVNHKLEAPRAPPKVLQPVKKGKKGKKGKAGKPGKPGGPGRPAKSASTPASASATGKKVTVQQKVAPTNQTNQSQIASGQRRSSFQVQLEQLKSESGTGEGNNHIECATSPPDTVPNSAPIKKEDNVPHVEPSVASAAAEIPVKNSSETLNGGTHLPSDPSKSETDAESNGNGSGSPPPPSNSTFVIPRLTDNPSCCENVDPAAWGPHEVVAFLNTNDCGSHSEGFLKNKITGTNLMTLTKDQIVILTGMKVGPALKIVNFIGQLKRFVTTAKARNALGK